MTTNNPISIARSAMTYLWGFRFSRDVTDVTKLIAFVQDNSIAIKEYMELVIDSVNAPPNILSAFIAHQLDSEVESPTIVNNKLIISDRSDIRIAFNNWMHSIAREGDNLANTVMNP